MVTPYFASLAEKALLAAKSNLSDVRGEVATLLASWGQKLPQPGLPRRAGDVRDDLQEALNQALSPPRRRAIRKPRINRQPVLWRSRSGFSTPASITSSK